MSVFRFRQFSVENIESAMKVNTDGVLLGALMTIRGEDRTYLDVGTGTGTIALMAAQRVCPGFPRLRTFSRTMLPERQVLPGKRRTLLRR